MDIFAVYILLFSSLYATYRFVTFYLDIRKYFLLFSSISLAGVALYAFFFLIGDIIPGFDTQLASEWSRVVASASILTALGFLIRNSKPEFARFPASFALLPLLLIPAYFFAMDTILLKEIVISIYLGGSLLIAILVYSLKIRTHPDFGLVLLGVVFLLTAFVIHWIPESTLPLGLWVNVLLVAAGIIIITKMYTSLYQVAEFDFKTENSGGTS